MRKRLYAVTYEEKPLSAYPEELDGRTSVAKQFNEYKDKLIAYTGGDPDILQLTVIEEAAWIWLRCQSLHAKIVAGELSDLESRQYSAWSNNLSRLLLRLKSLMALHLREAQGDDVTPPSLADIFGTDADDDADAA